ncbi:hypothetical protein Hamer_G009049 [Homarus americanus]|uniref:G-protein coupled receptors family 1 profile domain-containing protein n=1 Tax=Homarus americanus TaxID=6706 RepID=A0A8J5N957_HOMAM|nr:hypothetical protein Hamer_G009049 [Homarus americanus]
MNCSEGSCENCWGTYPCLLRYAVFQYYLIFVFGTVLTCKKTQKPLKVLLCSMFTTTLLMCLVVMPFKVEEAMTELLCDPNRMSKGVQISLNLFYTVLAEMEILYIAALAFIRAMAVWSNQRRTLGLRTAVVLVIIGSLYHVATTLGMMGPLYWGYVTEPWVVTAIAILYCCLNSILPISITIACYFSMMLAVLFNRRRLANNGHNTNGHKVVDQATLSMLAVFISNLLMALPHSLYHLVNEFIDDTYTIYTIVHLIFFIHFVVDPAVFVWFNRNYRDRVGAWVLLGLRKVRCCLSSFTAAFNLTPNTIPSTLNLTTTPSTLNLTTTPSTLNLTTTPSTLNLTTPSTLTLPHPPPLTLPHP